MGRAGREPRGPEVWGGSPFRRFTSIERSRSGILIPMIGSVVRALSSPVARTCILAAAIAAALTSRASAQYVQTATVHSDPGNHRIRGTFEPVMARLNRGASLGGAATVHLGLAPIAWVQVHGYGAYPLQGDWRRHYVADMAIAFVHNALRLTNEQYTLDSGAVPVYGGTVTWSESIQQPTVQRRLVGGHAGARFDQGRAELDPAATPAGDSLTMGARRLDVYAGLTVTRAVDTTIAVAGYGFRTNQRWITFSLDGLYAAALWPDEEVSNDGGRFGARLLGAWALGYPLGFGGTFELGYAPGGAGWYGSAGLGLAFTAGGFPN